MVMYSWRAIRAFGADEARRLDIETALYAAAINVVRSKTDWLDEKV